ncbi:MAG: hypothetical protein PHR18_01705 [Oscillospiraceae bacterium]|jgi:hypothetical protein|nr:hypothetical protein [Oscillospiraceae bacterium]MDD3832602.1 hypothetical protein [Oscillospiraceae bacterium]
MNIEHYNGLDDLLARNTSAGQFFNKLPSYVQEMIRERGNNILTEHRLRQYAENLVQGDK